MKENMPSMPPEIVSILVDDDASWKLTQEEIAMDMGENALGGDHNPCDPYTMTEESFAQLSPQEQLSYLEFTGILTLNPNRGQIPNDNPFKVGEEVAKQIWPELTDAVEKGNLTDDSH